MLRSTQGVLRTKLLRFTSTQFPNDSDDSFIQVVLPRQIQNTSTIRLLNYSIPWSFYLINTGVNDTLNFQLTGQTVKTITLPAGSYDSISIRTALLSALNTANALDWNVNISDSTLRMKITCTTAFKIIYEGSTVASILGLTSTPSSFVQSQEFSKQVRLLKTDQLLVNADCIGSSVDGKNTSSELLHVISLSHNQFGDILSNQYEINYDMQTLDNSLTDLRISVTDSDGNSFKFNNHPFSFVFLLTYIDYDNVNGY